MIPRQFPQVFRPADRLILSHRERSAKPEERIFKRTLEILDAQAADCIFVDDVAENVATAKRMGFRAFLFSSVAELITDLRKNELLPALEQLT